MQCEKIRVMVVDDSIVARSMIINGLSAHQRIEVVGYAINTMDAKRKIAKLNPDVITMDVEMPGQSGIDFLKEYIPTHPIPVILVSSLNLLYQCIDENIPIILRLRFSYEIDRTSIQRIKNTQVQ